MTASRLARALSLNNTNSLTLSVAPVNQKWRWGSVEPSPAVIIISLQINMYKEKRCCNCPPSTKTLTRHLHTHLHQCTRLPFHWPGRPQAHWSVSALWLWLSSLKQTSPQHGLQLEIFLTTRQQDWEAKGKPRHETRTNITI